MNTERSDQIVNTWQANGNPLRSASFTAERTFATTPSKLFRLLCPTTEYDWLPGWQCKLLHSRSGYAEYNAVFLTNFFGAEELFVCTRYDVDQAIDYSRTSADYSAKLDIRLKDNQDGTVTGHWLVSASALNEQGNAFVNAMDSLRTHFDQVLGQLEYYVSTGRMAA